ncbi:unnamed protein product [Linum trigynum]|uniref:Uncharacterized protein n=1 Tax=Linum trigynum TaxID=586398 RepID=A0AAV2ENJ0_9ROSI
MKSNLGRGGGSKWCRGRGHWVEAADGERRRGSEDLGRRTRDLGRGVRRRGSAKLGREEDSADEEWRVERRRGVTRGAPAASGCCASCCRRCSLLCWLGSTREEIWERRTQ